VLDNELMHNRNSSRNQIEIQQAARSIVAHWLELQGYTSDPETEQSAGIDIVAHGPGGNLLVRVKCALEPNKPLPMTDEEKDVLLSRAAEKGLIGCFAVVQLNTSLRLVGGVHFRFTT
jgi:hypothetical protein